MKLSRVAITAGGVFGYCQAARAHSFGQLYTLPIPVSMYLYAAAATLILSFVLIGCFASGRGLQKNFVVVSLRTPGPLGRALLLETRRVLRLASVACLALAIIAGLAGSNNAYRNINMTLFWIMFVLGLTYATALVGDVYASINPWRVIVEWLERWRPRSSEGKRAWPSSWSHYPALLLYFGFIWVELFAHTTPRSLSFLLLAYSVLNVLGAWWFGKRDWFRHGEFFGFYFHLIGKMAPLQRAQGNDGRTRLVLRHPFIALLDKTPRDLSQLLFVLFMLSSTAYDGLKDTVFWLGLYWKDLYQLLAPAGDSARIATYPLFQGGFGIFQSLAVPASAFAYLLVYLAFISLSKWLTRSPQSTYQLALHYAYTLIPISFVYNVSHYYTLALEQGARVLGLVSDPLGISWNLFGTARKSFGVMLDIELVWHSQVWLILAGHIVSVYLAHLQALKFATPRRAVVGQLPVLVLMVALTSLGLWILSLPIQSA